MTDPVETAWQNVLADWENDEAHKAFVGTCLSQGRLPEAGGRYRAINNEGGLRSKRAEQQMEKLLTLGMTLIQQDRTPPPKRRSRWLTILVALALTLLGMAVAIGMSDP